MPGRKKYSPTDRDRGRVEAMAAYGAPQETIAVEIGCDPTTLRKYFRIELDHGANRANMRVAESLYKKAISETHPQAVTAGIFWCKTRMGWKEPSSSLEITGKGGRPLFDIGKLSDEQLAALEGIVVSAGQATAARGDTRGEEVSEPPGQLH